MEQPIRKTYWQRHYTGYAIAKFTDGYHIVTWFRAHHNDADTIRPLKVTATRDEAKAWCVAHSRKTTREQHHQQAIDRAIAYLEKQGYKVIKP